MNVGETGASFYNFHSKSIFHTNMQARYILLTRSCNITSVLSQIRHYVMLYHVTKKLSEISHQPSTVTELVVTACLVSCYTEMCCHYLSCILIYYVQLLFYLVVYFQYCFRHTLGQIIINYNQPKTMYIHLI